MNLAAWWLMALMMFEFTLGLFLVFGGSNVPWYKRATAATLGLGFFVIFAVLATQLATGQTADLPQIEPKLLIFLFVFVNFFGFRLVSYLRRGTGRRAALAPCSRWPDAWSSVGPDSPCSCSAAPWRSAWSAICPDKGLLRHLDMPAEAEAHRAEQLVGVAFLDPAAIPREQ